MRSLIGLGDRELRDRGEFAIDDRGVHDYYRSGPEKDSEHAILGRGQLQDCA